MNLSLTFTSCGLGLFVAAQLLILALLSGFMAWLIGYLNPNEPKLSTAFLVAAVVLTLLATAAAKEWPQC